MLLKRLFSAFILSFSLFAALTASAAIGIDPDIVNFLPHQEPAKNILVMNKSKYTAFVKVTPFVIENPGTKHEKKVIIRDPSKSGILVTPARLIIPGGQRRYVRIILTKPVVHHDRIYRVTFTPEIAGMSIKKSIKGRRIGLHIIIAYGALIMARPPNMHPLLKFQRKGHELTLKNLGNTNVFILSGKQCAPDKKQCKKLADISMRLYAGLQKHIKLPYATKVKIKTKWLDNDKSYTTN